MKDAAYQSEAHAVIAGRIAHLRSLTLAQVVALPKATGEETVILNQKCAVTVYVQHSPYNLPDQTLVTVQVARRGFLGMVSYHTERGLVFSPDGSVRDATDEELQNSGG